MGINCNCCDKRELCGRLIRKFICIHDKRSSILVRFRQRSGQKTALKSFSRVLVVDGVNAVDQGTANAIADNLSLRHAQ